MVLAKDAEIRRQAMCALANLTDEQHCAAVASLRDAHGRSLLRYLLQYTAPPYPNTQRQVAPRPRLLRTTFAPPAPQPPPALLAPLRSSGVCGACTVCTWCMHGAAYAKK